MKKKHNTPDEKNVSSVSTYDASPIVIALTKSSSEYNPRKAVAWAKKRHDARLRAVLA